jgi:hypothetical protein
MDNLLDTLKNLPSNMEEALKFSLKCDYEVEFGNIEAIKLSHQLRVVAKACLMGCDKIDDAVLAEAEKFHKTELAEIWGAKVSQVGTEYLYDKCNDSEYDTLLQKKTNAANDLKERVKFLKSLKPGMAVNPDTGEPLFPPAKSSTTKVVFTLK